MKLLDTNIVIYFLSKKGPLYEATKKIISNEQEEFCISALTYFEIFHGVAKQDRAEVKNILEIFEILDIDQSIAEKAAHLMADFKKSKQMKIDALIGATALVHDITLVTNNKKDFAWIRDLAIEGI